MLFSREELIRIIEKSSSLYERIGDAFSSRESAEHNASVQVRLDKWRQAVAKEDMQQFKQRLGRDKLDLDEARQIVTGVALKDKDNLPSWVRTLREMASTASEFKATHDHNDSFCQLGFIEQKDPLPFEELLTPYVLLARKRIREMSGLAHHLLNDNSYFALERQLLERLSTIMAPTLLLQFSWYKNRLGYNPAFAALFNQKTDSLSREYYDTFVTDMLSWGFVPFFCEYPVLARLTAGVTEQWLEVVSEFIERLDADWNNISIRFGANKDLEQVIAINPGLSDEHHNGRTVFSLTFASGLKLVYKPKNIGIDAAYYDLLNWLNTRNPSFFLKTLKLINRLTYGWVEFVEHLPCNNVEEIKRYYQRSGHLLGVVYALRGKDCHYENIITNADNPVLVDVEMLLYPRMNGLPGLITGESQSFGGIFEKSVLNTGFLPQKDIKLGDKSYDFSGLGGLSEEEKYPSLVWKNMNTDEMSSTNENRPALPNKNLPLLDGKCISPREFADEVVSGFEEMYRFLLQNRDALTDTDGPLVAMQDTKLRFVLRATRIYAAMLTQSLQPKYLHDGADRSMEIERLGYSLFKADLLYWPLLQAEERALEQLDIPHFGYFANQNILQVSTDKIIENCFIRTGYDLVMEHLQNLSKKDMELQSSLIRAAFTTRYRLESSATNGAEDFSVKLNDVIPLSQNELIAEAILLGEELEKQAISEGTGITWIQIGVADDTEDFNLQPMTLELYHGCCGIAFFLAALGKVTGEAKYSDLAKTALQPLRETLNGPHAEAAAKAMGLGAAQGLGSVIYGLVRIGEFLKDKSLLNDAYKAASLISNDLITAGQTFDIISGAAGTILSLLSLYKAEGNREDKAEQKAEKKKQVLDKAILCGNQLLQNWVINDTNQSDMRTLTGFSHGAAGIAYALLRLYELTGQSELLSAAERAIAYEKSVFCEEEANWPDFRLVKNDRKPPFMSSWCHGASGIGLARIGGLSLLDSAAIRKDIEVSLQTTKETSLQVSDHLCCGNFGRVDVLLTAAQKLSRPELQKEALQRASWVVARKNETGRFCYNWSRTLPVYGLFQGSSGIGYELLRLAYPDILPSLLLFE